MNAICELTLSPEVRFVGTVSRFLGDLCTSVLGDADLSSRLVVVAHELLENAVRYSVDGTAKIKVGIDRDGGTTRIFVATTNRTNGARKAELEGLIAEIERATDRDAFYQTLLVRTRKRTDGSGLGLGRILAEADMDLRCEIEDDVVHLRAETIIQEKS